MMLNRISDRGLSGDAANPLASARPFEALTALDAPRPLPAVDLIDQDGSPFSIDELAGRHALVFFGFTNCPDICPLTLAVIADAVRDIRTRSPELAPEVLFVSVDPSRDTPSRIGFYVDAFDDQFIGATAEDEILAPLLETLSVTVHKESQDGETYNVVHNGTIYVLDDAGRWIAIFGGSTHRAIDIVNDYLSLRAEAARE
jgi:protein SCO1/2